MQNLFIKFPFYADWHERVAEDFINRRYNGVIIPDLFIFLKYFAAFCFVQGKQRQWVVYYGLYAYT